MVEFTAPDTVCIRENIRVENSSTGAIKYEWDFCMLDVYELPTQETVLEHSLINRIASIDLVQQEGIWYGLAVDDANGNIIRLVFKDGLDSVPTLENLGDFNQFDRPVDIDIINDNGNWLAILADFGSSALGMLNFGSDLNNIPTAHDLGDFSILNQPRSLEVENDNGNWVGIISNAAGKSITLINWGVSILSSPNPPIINRVIGVSLYSVDIIYTNSGWYGLTSSRDNSAVYRLVFGTSLFKIPNVIGMSTLPQWPGGISLIEDEGRYVGFINGLAGDLYRFNFGNSMANNTGYKKVNDLIDFKLRFNFNIIKDKGTISLYSSEVQSNKIDKLTFHKQCDQSTDYSEEVEPEIAYQSTGNKNIRLTISNDNCTIDSTFSIYVKEDIAPTLDIQAGDICEGSTTQLTFSTENTDNIISQLWTIENTTFTEDTINYTFPSPGTYPVTLEVETADGCGQRVTKDITIYEPPEPEFVVDKEVICTNGEIAFQNLTDTKGADEIITYTWDFNGEGSSTEANPTFAFSSGGSKTVSLTASIPGCSNTYDTTFVVEQGPVVDFSTPPQICQGDEVTFENLTAGENITGFSWNFGDGGTYSSTALESPSYVYDSAGTYIASLEVNNTVGCANSLSKTITIYARPQAAFTADIACAGAPTQFIDESTTGINSNVVAWEWSFGDGGEAAPEGTAQEGRSQARNPQYTYALPGVYDATLVVLTSAGCTDTLSQEIVVESAVQADFSTQTLCPSDSNPFTVQFTDMSTVNDDEEISEWLWTINGENFVIANPEYAFEEPGTYQVSLTVFSATACNASVTKNITINTPPTPDFSFVANCAGQAISFSNESLSEEVEISEYRWDFGGLGVSYEENPAFVFEEAGNYQVSFSLETSEGCEYTYSQEVSVPAAPQAAFTADVVYGGVPLTVNFSNTSTDADSLSWDFGGAASSNEANPSYTFSEPGIYTVSLEVQSDLGCTDVYRETVEVVAPSYDLQLQRISLLSEEGDPNISLLLTMRNLSNLTVSDFDISITLDEVLTITESFEGSLEPGEIINYPLDFTISSQLNQDIDLRYICTRLSALPDEKNITNNRTCLSLNNTLSVMSPHPNPSSERVMVEMVLPQKDIVRFSLLTTKGELVENIVFNDTKVGLNTFEIDVSKMITGNYLLQVGYSDHSETYRLMVGP
ncbi:PKD domain-containing protein [Catalinimonas alkaloidigena]|uniref:PKD domain-containing protein n=1 Tax=Catalinimonas alkaloidigena TaxID=1075417 RepID=UPI002406D0BF|nr:PKD domain-containing protein [Catalinimonas alkaloidigena]